MISRRIRYPEARAMMLLTVRQFRVVAGTPSSFSISVLQSEGFGFFDSGGVMFRQFRDKGFFVAESGKQRAIDILGDPGFTPALKCQAAD